ncbi:MAG: HD domain-containing protein [Allomuricauda sp.]
MKKDLLVQNTVAFVKESLKGAEGGHDWFHIERVYKNALLLLQMEDKADFLVVQLAALLHDIADPKFHHGDESIGPKVAREFLNSQHLETHLIEHIVNIIQHMSYKNSLDSTGERFSSLELKIVQDADRLDAMGAIGIARAFNYGGFKNRALFNPAIPPNLNMTKEEYKRSNAPTINHFYEKLLLLKDGMNTAAGKKIAQERHDFMQAFLEQFYKEWGHQPKDTP